VQKLKKKKKSSGTKGLNKIKGEHKPAVLVYPKKRGWGNAKRLPYYGMLRKAGREEDQRTAGEDRLSKKRVEAGMD
jgi:hypothetical protein